MRRPTAVKAAFIAAPIMLRWRSDTSSSSTRALGHGRAEGRRRAAGDRRAILEPIAIECSQGSLPTVSPGILLSGSS